MKFKIFAVLAAFAVFFSCNTFKKAQAPTKSTYADTLAIGIFNRIHAGYEDMKLSADKSFSAWQSFYDSNISDINVLIAYDSTRKNNAVILILTTQWRDRFLRYENEHSVKSTLNAGQVIIYQDAMDNAGKKVYLTESNYQ